MCDDGLLIVGDDDGAFEWFVRMQSNKSGEFAITGVGVVYIIRHLNGTIFGWKIEIHFDVVVVIEETVSIMTV